MTAFIRERRSGLFVFLAGLLFLAIFALQYHDLAGDSDVWWHMQYGEEVVRNLDWTQHHDAWSWTQADDSWWYVSWFAGVALFAVHAAFGPWGITLLQSALFLAVAGLYLHLARRRGGVGVADMFLLALVFMAIRPAAAQPKAEMFSVFFFGLSVWVYVDARRSGRDRFWLLPLVFWAWVNAHGAGLVPLLLLGALVTGETVARRAGTGLDARSYRRLLIFGGVAVIATAVNPEGPALVLEGFRSILGFVGGEERLRIDEYATRWSRLVPQDVEGASKAVAGWATIGLFVLQFTATLRRWRHERAFDPAVALASLGFFFMGMQMARAGIFYPIFALMVLGGLLRTRPASDRALPRTEVLAAGALVALTVVALGLHVTVRTAWSWGWQSLERVQPVLESRFVREHELPAPLFNDYVSGGYLVWDLFPEYEVFIDPRYGPYPEDLLARYDDLARRPDQQKVERTTRHFGFRTAVIGHRTLAELSQAFDRSDQWTLVFLGPTAAIFVRDDLVGEELRAAIPSNTDPRRLARYGDPLALVSAANVVLYREPGLVVDLVDMVGREMSSLMPRHRRILDELDAVLVRLGWHAQDGRRLTAEEMVGRFAHLYRSGDLDSARFVVAAYLVEHPDDARMWFNRACVESLAGRIGAAADALDRAIAKGYANLDGIATDKDLAALRAAPEFVELVERHDLEFPGRAR